MNMCDDCIYSVVNEPEKTGEGEYTWGVMNPCRDCLNTYSQPPGFMRLSVKRAKELLEMRNES